MNYFRFPINENYVDVNESIQSVGGDEDDLLDDDDREEKELNNDEAEEDDDMNLSSSDQIHPTPLTDVMLNKKITQSIQENSSRQIICLI